MLCYRQYVSLCDSILYEVLPHYLLLLQDLHRIQLFLIFLTSPLSNQIDLPEATLTYEAQWFEALRTDLTILLSCWIDYRILQGLFRYFFDLFAELEGLLASVILIIGFICNWVFNQDVIVAAQF
jgi:hypothetical protein